jgi:DNA invertase Pin-like site-specific DNA recombinase
VQALRKHWRRRAADLARESKRPIAPELPHSEPAEDQQESAMFQMMGVFAEFERSMIRERVNAGIARAKADGKHCGRPFIDTKLEDRIREALAAPGRPGLHKIAKQFGVGSGTVQRIAAAS